MRKLGIIMHAVKGMSDDEYLREISALGFGSTFNVPLEERAQYEFINACARNNVCCETLHAKCSGICDLWLDNTNSETALNNFMHCVDVCSASNVPTAVVHLDGGGCTPGVTAAGCDRIARLIEYACAKNIKIAFENQASYEKHAWVFDTYKIENVGFCYDSGHARFAKGGDNFVRMFGERLVALHLHDNLGRVVDGNNDFHMIPLDGSMDFDRIAADIKNSGYEGTLMLELKYNGSVGNAHYYDKLSSHEYLKRAADAAKKLRFMIDGE